jgi:probable rRNA maturation factor
MINFHVEEIDFKVANPIKTKRWLKNTIQAEGYELSEINYIFCSDDYLHKMNLEYLDHDTLTDIITFDNSDGEKQIEGDIFVSIDRVHDNAKDFNSTFEQEFRRVVVHGILHLCGYFDKSVEDEKLMRMKEEYYLNLWQ